MNFASSSSNQLNINQLVVGTGPVMVLPVRSLVEAGLYSQDSLVTDRLFSFFLVTLFGNPALPPVSQQPSDTILSELMKFFRRASNDPEQRPKNVKKLNYQYDFIIVGKNIFVSSEVR